MLRVGYRILVCLKLGRFSPVLRQARKKRLLPHLDMVM